MKVLQINSVCGVGSTGRICTDIAQLLSLNSIDSKIAYGRGVVPQQYEQYALKFVGDFEVKVHVLQSRVFDNTGFGCTSATKKLVEYISDYDPDVIHLHNLHGYYINIKVLFDFLKTYKKKVIWTLHDCWSFTGHCAHFSLIGCNKWAAEGCSNCPSKKGYPKSLFFDNSKNNFLLKKEIFSGMENLTIVTPSKWLADLVSKSFLGQYSIQLINNGIDLSKFRFVESDFRAKYNLGNKHIVLCVSNVWNRSKGFDDILKLAEMLDKDYKIVMVGVSKSQKESINPDILCIERTNNIEELVEIYSAADVFFNPTYQDTYPTVNLEAQACGLRVITYRTGGSVESVPCGNIIDQGDLTAAVKLIKNFKDLKISDRSTFDYNKCIEQYMSLYLQ